MSYLQLIVIEIQTIYAHTTYYNAVNFYKYVIIDII